MSRQRNRQHDEIDEYYDDYDDDDQYDDYVPGKKAATAAPPKSNKQKSNVKVATGGAKARAGQAAKNVQQQPKPKTEAATSAALALKETSTSPIGSSKDAIETVFKPLINKEVGGKEANNPVLFADLSDDEAITGEVSDTSSPDNSLTVIVAGHVDAGSICQHLIPFLKNSNFIIMDQ